MFASILTLASGRLKQKTFSVGVFAGVLRVIFTKFVMTQDDTVGSMMHDNRTIPFS